MKVNCFLCGAEFGASSPLARYCSVKCKQAAYRNKRNAATVTDEPVAVTNVTVTESEGVTAIPDPGSATRRVGYTPLHANLTRQQLCKAINSHPHNEWKDCSEFHELMRRLKEWPLDRLKAEGYWIPSWKEFGLKPVDCEKPVDNSINQLCQIGQNMAVAALVDE